MHGRPADKYGEIGVNLVKWLDSVVVLSLLCNQAKIKKGIGCHSSLAGLLAMLLDNVPVIRRRSSSNVEVSIANCISYRHHFRAAQ